MKGGSTETKEEVERMIGSTPEGRLRTLEKRVDELEKHVSDILNKDVRAPIVPEEENNPAQNA